MGRRGRSRRSPAAEGYGQVEIWRGMLGHYERLQTQGTKLLAGLDAEMAKLTEKREKLVADIAKAPDEIELYRAKLEAGVIERTISAPVTERATRTKRNRRRRKDGQPAETPLARLMRLTQELDRLTKEIGPEKLAARIAAREAREVADVAT